MSATETPKVALVFPPFGPQIVPSLGLSLLSAGVKQRGFDCRSFYWNLEVVPALPGVNTADRLGSHLLLSLPQLFPLNEQVFVSELFPDFRERDADVEAMVDALDARWKKSLKPFSRAPSVVLEGFREVAPQLLRDLVERLEPYEIVGINTTYFQNVPALALARQVKQRWPTKRVVLGGPNCFDTLARVLVERFPFIDYAFNGEVDFAFPEFVTRLAAGDPVDQVPGIVFRRDDGTVVEGPEAVPLKDLDALPLPDFDDYVIERERTGVDRHYPLWLALESSRGCWWGAKHHCTFCGLNAHGMVYRAKSQDRFRWEVEEIVRRYDTRYIRTTDNIMSMRYFDEFVEWAKQSDLNVYYHYEIKSNLTRKQMFRLAQAGVRRVQPGIESLSSSVLDLMRKGVSAAQNVAVMKYARDYGMEVNWNILGGFPGEEAGEYEILTRNLRKLVHLQPPEGVFPIEYHRFSPYHDEPEAFGLKLRPSPKYSVLYPFEEEVIAALGYFFEREDAPQFPYLKEPAMEVRRWREVFVRDEATLDWAQDGDDVVVRDRRSGFDRVDYRLRDAAAQVFHALDAPRRLSAVARDLANGKAPAPAGGAADGLSPASLADHDRDSRTSVGLLRRVVDRWRQGAVRRETIAFGVDEFTQDPAGTLRPLVEAGILWVEADQYVALPVSSHHARILHGEA